MTERVETRWGERPPRPGWRRCSQLAKTHLDYRLDQLGPGEYLWTTPHGLHRHVDHTGTHVLDDTTAHQLLIGDELDRALDRIAAAHGITLRV